MNVQQAIVAFAQSEKIKSGLIWSSQVIQRVTGQPQGLERTGGEIAAKLLLEMISHEVSLTERLSKNSAWKQVDRHLRMALVMLNSGVGEESVWHVTQALSQVTRIGQIALSLLRDNNLLDGRCDDLQG
jgi:hypothetical protein